jgi:hypothetical protein
VSFTFNRKAKSMHYRPIVRAPIVIAAASALALLAVPARAQHGAESATRSVQVVLPDSFPAPGARALVVRFATGRDLIILNREHATPQALAAAVALLKELRRRHGVVANTQVVTMQGFTPIRRGAERASARFRASIQALNSRPISRVGNVGRGRWIELVDSRIGRVGS